MTTAEIKAALAQFEPALWTRVIPDVPQTSFLNIGGQLRLIGIEPPHNDEPDTPHGWYTCERILFDSWDDLAACIIDPQSDSDGYQAIAALLKEYPGAFARPGAFKPEDFHPRFRRARRDADGSYYIEALWLSPESKPLPVHS